MGWNGLRATGSGSPSAPGARRGFSVAGGNFLPFPVKESAFPKAWRSEPGPETGRGFFRKSAGPLPCGRGRLPPGASGFPSRGGRPEWDRGGRAEGSPRNSGLGRERDGLLLSPSAGADGRLRAYDRRLSSPGEEDFRTPEGLGPPLSGFLFPGPEVSDLRTF